MSENFPNGLEREGSRLRKSFVSTIAVKQQLLHYSTDKEKKRSVCVCVRMRTLCMWSVGLGLLGVRSIRGGVAFEKSYSDRNKREKSLIFSNLFILGNPCVFILLY